VDPAKAVPRPAKPARQNVGCRLTEALGQRGSRRLRCSVGRSVADGRRR